MNYVLVYYIISDSYRYDPCMRCVAGDFLLLIQGHDCWWWLCFLAPSSGSRLNLDDYWIMLPAIDYQISTIFILSGHWRGFFLWNLWGSSRILEVITDAPDDAWDSRILFFWRRILSLFQESLSLSLSLSAENLNGAHQSRGILVEESGNTFAEWAARWPPATPPISPCQSAWRSVAGRHSLPGITAAIWIIWGISHSPTRLAVS